MAGRAVRRLMTPGAGSPISLRDGPMSDQPVRGVWHLHSMALLARRFGVTQVAGDESRRDLRTVNPHPIGPVRTRLLVHMTAHAERLRMASLTRPAVLSRRELMVLSP
jgi:hypothetical protein